MKLFIKDFLCSKPKKHFNLTKALSCLEPDLQILLICSLKLSSWSMCIPSNLTDEATSTTLFPIQNCLSLLVWLLFWIIMDLNLSGLTIILFSENHLIAFWDSAITVSTNNVTYFGNEYNVLSPAKLCSDAFLMQKKKSFKSLLNNIGGRLNLAEPPRLRLWSHYKRCWHEHVVYGFSNTCKYISEHCH